MNRSKPHPMTEKALKKGAKILRNYMTAHGFGQIAAGKALGISQRHVSNILNQKAVLPFELWLMIRQEEKCR